MAHNKHNPDTTDDHIQRNHPLYPADDLELRRIFVAASLPEGHPHALRIRHRKPEVDESIIHSPSFTNKLRRQLSRKSLVTDKSRKDTASKLNLRPLVLSRKRSEHGHPELAGGYDDDAQSLCLTGSRLASLANDSCVMVDTNSVQQVQSSKLLDRYAVDPDEPRRSVSVPPASCVADSASQQRRSLSSDMKQELRGALTVYLPGPTFMNADDIWQSSPTVVQTNAARFLKTLNSADSQLPSPQLSSPDLSQPQLVRVKSRSSEEHKALPRESTNSLHLYDMQISQHLRTRSQVSEASRASEPDRQNRHTHASLNSIVLSSVGPERCKSISSSGLAGSAGPTWEKVLEDESSSIYSRRPSTALDAPLVPQTEHASDLPRETVQGKPMALNMSELIGQGKEATACQAERVVSVSTGISFMAGESASHADLRKSTSVSSSACVSTWPVQKMTGSLPKSDSSGSLGKLSRFREDLNAASTVPKSRKKRRSVLRILFPGLRRSKVRSASTPLLSGQTQSFLNQTYDGTGDVQDFLTVPRSSSRPQGAQRAASFTDNTELRPVSAHSVSSSAATPSLQSRQSLVNYERSLSIVGDDRRRKSTLGGPKFEGNANEDQDDYPERTIRRASPLFGPSRKGTEEALMEKALLQHQAEKAALLRPSNQKIETAPAPRHAPVFTSPFGFRTPTEARLTSATLEELDPLEAEEPPAVRRSQSMQDLRSPDDVDDVAARSIQSRGKKRSTIWTIDTANTKGTKSHLRAFAPPRSWSQYPSHTREQRCSSAGRHNGIICRDFAHGEAPCNVHQAISVETMKSHKGWPRLANAKRRNWIGKSRSMTFGTVFRYYSNLLTSSAARNRRSSMATGGRLEHPELEVLPPVLPIYSSSPHSDLKDQSSRSTGDLEEDHRIKEWLNPRHRRCEESSWCVDKSSSEQAPAVAELHDGSQSMHSQAVTDVGLGDHLEDMPILLGSLDGNVEDKPAEPDRALSARRLSRMYQAYVQLPTSLDNTEVKRNGAVDEFDHTSDGPAIVESPDIDSKMSPPGFLAVPASKRRLSSGPITRHFPSVTVVDDCKGHWRSVSLLSVDSRRSIRKSTRDLLEVVRATQTEELAKLLSTSEPSTTDANTL